MEAKRRGLSTGNSQTPSYREAFVKRYFNNPAAFITDCIHFGLGGQQSGGRSAATPYQLAIANVLPNRKRVAVRGPHGLGKTALSSWIVLWFVLTREAAQCDWKVITTASAWRQLTVYLWPEIHKWSRKIRWDRVIWRSAFNDNELLGLQLKLGNGAATAVASSDSDYIEGAHADELLYLFDESKIIPPKTWESAEGAFASGNCYWLSVSTPGEPVGTFYEIHKRKPGTEDWWVRHVTLAETIACGRVLPGWAEQRKLQWGEESAVYKTRVLGEFASSDEDGVIPLAWIELANERYAEWIKAGKPGTYHGMGVDVGVVSDKSVIAKRWDVNDERFGQVISSLKYIAKEDTMQLAGRLAGVLGRGGQGGRAVVDANGIGAGTVHRLAEMGLPAEAFIAQERTLARDKSGEFGFADRRSWAWWNMREMLDPASDDNLCLPPDDILTGDLTSPKYRVMSGGKIRVESKDDVKKRLRRSTDAADACISILDPTRVEPYHTPAGTVSLPERFLQQQDPETLSRAQGVAAVVGDRPFDDAGRFVPPPRTQRRRW